MGDKKILDGEPGKLFDKMLNSINLSRENIALASYIPEGMRVIMIMKSF